MEGWGYELGSEFQKRNNPKPISNCLGTILAVGDDWKVSIQNGKFIIDKHNGYICKHILARSSNFDLTHSQSGSISTSCPISAHGGSGYTASGSMQGHVNLHTIDDWRPGNKVMVAPCDDNQMFFIVDIV